MVSVLLTRSSILDLRALGTTGNGRRLLARSRAIREGTRVTVHLLYLVVGLGVLGGAAWVRPVIVPILIYGNLALLVNSAVDAATRHQLLETRKGD